MIAQELVNFIGMASAFAIGWRTGEVIDQCSANTYAAYRIAMVAAFSMASYFSIGAFLYRIDISPDACAILVIGAVYCLAEQVPAITSRIKRVHDDTGTVMSKLRIKLKKK